MEAIFLLLALGYPFFVVWMTGQSRQARMHKLEQELAALRKEFQAWKEAQAPGAPKPAADVGRASPQPQARTVPTPATLVVASPPTAAPAAPMAKPQPQQAPIKPDAAAGATPAPGPGPAPKAPTPTPASPPTKALPGWLSAAIAWLFTGNLVAKLGLVILFIGVGFLLKYVAETVYVPIEVRLAGVVLATLALLGWGWRLRSTRREIGLPIQGTAIAILMLVVFGAYHRYELIPAGFAFALLVVLTAFTCLLAVLQESPWLAAFGITGGFAGPLLLSTGGGRHVVLFSYYALLNAGVFWLAIKRAWRPLNLIGFAFTFVVGSAWGATYYTPAHYASAQFFLVLFFLFYVGIAIAFARRQQTRLKDYVDATLVLGTPLLAFGLQAGLVKDMAFGLALSALALGLFYLALAVFLWRRGGERWRVLVETFAALGVIFGTLAIPFALDGRWTSGMWALEGAGFVWFGLRRQRRTTWMFGILLQTGAWIGFLGAATGLDAQAAQTSNLWLGFLLLAGSAFAIARSFRQHAHDSPQLLSRIANASLVIAAVWLLAGAWTEAILHTSGGLLSNALVGGAMLTAGLLYLSAARLAWPLARRLAAIAQAAAALALVFVSAADWQWLRMREGEGGEPLLGVLMIAVAALATSRFSQRPADPQAGRLSTAFLLWGGAWWFGPAMSIAAGRLLFLAPASLGSEDARWTALYALLVAASAAACARLGPRLGWRKLHWLGAASWGLLALFTFPILLLLYGMRTMPDPGIWLAWALLLAGSEVVLLRWAADGAPIKPLLLRAVHVVRTAGPWLAIWPTGAILIARWLAGPDAAGNDYLQLTWTTGAAWGNYLPAWAMMLVLAWLVRRSLAGSWSTAPLAPWYRRSVIPCGVFLMLALAALWNLAHDGNMAPLPYLPLLNPLDLTTGFALLLYLDAARALRAEREEQESRQALYRRLRIGGLAAAWAWFNLVLLRSAAHYLGIRYQVDVLLASQFVQAMLSLVWCASALVLMRYAARRAWRWAWCVGAVLIGIVVLKLFTFDLANSGSLARVVSFVSVGLLMVLIGYFAPFPKKETGASPAPQHA